MHSFHLSEPVGPADHLLGMQGAPVTVVEYGDFECPNCKQAAPSLQLLLAVRSRCGSCSGTSHWRKCIRMRCVPPRRPNGGAQGKFWRMHDLLFEKQSHLKLPQLFEYAQSLDLDMARFTAELDDEIYLQRVREHQSSGKASDVRSTPGFFVNGHIQDVSYGLGSLFEAVEAELSPAPPPGSLHPASHHRSAGR